MSPARIKSILTSVKRVREGRSLTVKQFKKTAGSDVSCVQRDTRLLQWWLKTKGFSPRGNPLCMIKVTRLCLRALYMWSKPWFLSQGLVLGAPCHRVKLALHLSPVGERSWVATLPAVCVVVAISRGTSTAWRCWPYFEHSNTFYQTWEITMCRCEHRHF